ncbi:MAG TPA: alpha-D-ribose 1-methylphosphonate 5-triphosphate diphosphatase [Paracoccaceae bacterium]|nr:alpha-D-ribose 1-methylphosphonate 5-triphosphate diphosphatase [Paracoccaceae bacterium]
MTRVLEAPDGAEPSARRDGETVLSNARLVTPEGVRPGALLIRDGRIADLSGATAVRGAEDMEGDLLAPGLVELHTDNLEGHMEPRPGVRWPQAAAVVAHDAEFASVGVTTVFDAVRVGSVLSFRKANYGAYAREAADAILRLKREGALRISHLLHLRAEICSETLLEEMDAFGPEDGIRIVSLMDHTPGFRQFRDVEKLRAYHEGRYGRANMDFDAYLAFLADLKAKVGPEHEAGAVARAKALGATLASHDDTDAAHPAVSAAHGARIAEFPTTREAAEASRAHGLAVLMGAPNLLRGGSHSGNVAAAELAEAGLLDILSSDYAPSSLLMGALRLGELWGDVARGFATVTSAPAAATGLDDRGRLAPGLRADLVRVADRFEAPVVRGLWVAGRRV